MLAIVMTVSLAIPVFAEESMEPQYGTIKVEYSDARGTIENLDVMVLDGYVYAHMASFCERLGYQWQQENGLVTIYAAGIWYDEAPALAIHFRPGDTTVSYNPLCGIEIEYDAPTPFIENDRGIWVPLQYTLTLLGGSRNITGDILVIQMPTANVLSVAAMIMNSGGVLSFDWVDDFGYSETATNVTDGAARVVTLFEGLLSFDGSAWTSFVDWNAFDKKFGKTLAALMCTYSSDELKDSIEEVEVMLDVFADDGALGSMLRTQEALIDSDVNAWEKICEEKLAQLKAGCGTLPQYNMAYQQYERATKKQDLFSAVGADEIISIQDGLANATNALEWAKRIGYGVTYMAEFQQRDDFQATVLKNYFATRKDTDKLDDAAAKAIADYATSDIIEYTLSKFFENHALEILVDKSGLDALMGVPANLLLLAWDIMSETIPFYSEGLDSVENREISNYAQQVQNDAYQNLNTLIASLRADTASISPEDCVQLAEYCYVYLKSCYIARSFAIESLEGISEETYKKLESKINAETDVNQKIVKYLSILGQADLENSCLILGFLPKNNRELLEIYSDADLVAIVQQHSTSGYERILDMYYESISCNWTNCDNDGWNDVGDPDNACYILSTYEADLTLSEVGYSLLDINNDGQSELIIALIHESGIDIFPELYTGKFYDLYTIVNGEVLHVVSAGERSHYNLAVDHSINHRGSSGAASSVNTNYQLVGTDGTLKINQAIVYDGWRDSNNPYFYATTEYYNRETYEYDYNVLKPISEEEASVLLDSFPDNQMLELIPFDQYAYSGKTNTENHDNDEILTEDQYALNIFLSNFSEQWFCESSTYVPYKIGKLQIQGFSEPTIPKNKITELSHYAEGRPVKTTGGLFAWKAWKEAKIF